ncbi:MAG: O-antigen ligase family protein [Betaproteobacteria bacterium]
MSFIYSFLNFAQPGILFSEISWLRPMLLASAIALLVGISRKSSYSRQSVFYSSTFVWLLVFVVVQIASVYYGGIWSMVDEFAFWDVYPMFVAISILLMNDAVSLKRFVWGMIVGGMVVVAYGIFSVPDHGGYQGTGRAGAYGMYENHNDYSFIIIQIVPFIFMYMWAVRSVVLRGLLGLSLVGCVTGIFMSLSRGGMIGLVVESILLVLFGMQGKRRLLLLPVILFVGAGAVVYQYAQRAENQSNYTADDAESGRIELWKAGLNMLRAHPFLGVGSRRFPEYAAQYYDLSHDMQGKVSHNTYVEIFSGSGLIGFIAFACFAVSLARELHRRPESTGPPILEATRIGTLISFYSILFRALLDAKVHDWSIYTLCAIGIVCAALQRNAHSTSRIK